MENKKEIFQGWRSFIVWIACLVITIVLLFFPERIEKSIGLLYWFGGMCSIVLGRNVIKHNIDKRQ